MKTRRKKSYRKRFLLTKTSMVICLFLCVLLANAGDWPPDPIEDTEIPGQGAMRCQTDFITPNGAYLFQSFWRDDGGYYRMVPIENGVIQWPDDPKWNGPILISVLPGTGVIQAQSDYITPNGQYLQQSFWRGNRGYTRQVPIVNNEIDWDNAPLTWDGPFYLWPYPGSGDMRGQDDFILPNTGDLFQRYWRGSQEYWRRVPVEGGIIKWNKASEWCGPITYSSLPGSEDIQTLNGFIEPNGKDLLDGFWRNDLGYWRTIRFKGGNYFDLAPLGTSHLDWIFSTYAWTAFSGFPHHIGDDYYADYWVHNYGNTWGADAYAMAAGVVIYAGESPAGWGYGKQVVVRCAHDPGFAYRYAQLKTVEVNVGELVGFGTLLGTVGNSDGASNPHLHSVLYKNISSSDSSLANLKAGKSPSGAIPSPIPPTKYAAPFYNDAGGNNQIEVVMVDDGDTGFVKAGPDIYWHEEDIGQGGDMLWTYVNGNQPVNSASWSPKLQQAGNYKVMVFIPPGYATTRSAKYKVKANGITYNPSAVNQNNNNNKWVTLGTYYFNASNNGSEFVKLTDATGEPASTYRMVAFDAVKWIKQ